MPKVTMYFLMPGGGVRYPQQFYGRLEKSGMVIRDHVARAMSTSKVELERKDVDFIPIPYPRGSLVEFPVAFEIEAIGFPERKAKLTDLFVDQLKVDMVFALDVAGLVSGNYWDIRCVNPLVWIKYVDPDGPHI